METRYIIAGVVVAVGIALVVFGDRLKSLPAWVASWFKRAPEPPSAGTPDHQAAYNAVLVLIAHFEAVKCEAGEKLVREAGAHLFHEGPHP